MWGFTVPKDAARKPPSGGEQLPLAFDAPAPAEARKIAAGRRKGRQAPLRVCGQCGGRFASWREDGLCGKCEEDGSKRETATPAMNAPAVCGSCGHAGTDVLFGLCADCFGGAA